MTQNNDHPIAPAHWRKSTINDTGSYVNGVAFKDDDWHNSGVPIIRIQNLTDESKHFNKTTRIVREDSRIDDGDMLVSWSATLDAFRWNLGPAVLNQHIFKVVPNPERVDDRFLFYLLKESIAEMRMSAHVHGSTMKHINRGPFLAHEVFLPPLDEQKQIVAAIETHFSRLDDAVAALQRARAQLKRYRASVLKAACEGKLVPTEAELTRREGRSYEPASVLLERIRAEREAATGKGRGKAKTVPKLDTSDMPMPELPAGWTWTSLCALLSEPLSNGRSVPDATKGFPVLRLTSIHGRIVDTTQQKIGEWSESEASRFLIAAGDFLVARGNGSLKLVGRGALVAIDPDSVAFPDTLIRIRTHPELISSRYIAAIWHSAVIREQIERLARTTAGIYKINQQDLSNLHIPFPPFAEQKRIVEEIERVISVVDKMEASVETNLKRAESLRQSILRMAFRGELVNTATGDISTDPIDLAIRNLAPVHEEVAGQPLR